MLVIFSGPAPHHLLGTEPEAGAPPVLPVPDPVRPALHALREGDP